MKVRWSPEAAEDLERIALRVHEASPEASRRIVRAIYDGIIGLENFPGLGRPGREPGTRELILGGLPYVAVYASSGTLSKFRASGTARKTGRNRLDEWTASLRRRPPPLAKAGIKSR